MAQKVGYFQDDVVFEEGPFVMVYINGWRIEGEVVGNKCPALLMPSIYALLRKEGLYEHKTEDEDRVAKAVDWLNEQVRLGVIVLEGAVWRYPELQ